MVSKDTQGHFEEEARGYFAFLANIGLTKHLGSMEATRRLVELCHLGSGQVVLDVGCGVGATASYLAKAIGCRVVGVDLIERMIEQSRERARADGIEDRAAFVVADARHKVVCASIRILCWLVARTALRCSRGAQTPESSAR